MSDFTRAWTVNFADYITAAVAEAVGSLGPVMAQLGASAAEDMADSIRYMADNIGPDLEKANYELVTRAQAATLAQYHNSREAGRKSGAYRSGLAGRNHRYAGHVLEQTITAASFVYSDQHTIQFANVTALEANARQWMRLNFGAGMAGSGSLPPVQVVEGLALGYDIPTRRAFDIPDGIGRNGRWIGADFYPGGSLSDAQKKQGTFMKRKKTRGIRAEHWLDAGLQSLATGMAPAYKAAVNDAWQRMPMVVTSFMNRGHFQRSWRGASGRFVSKARVV